MIPPDKPIHPLVSGGLLFVLYVAIVASAAARYGVRPGIAAGFVLPIIALVVFGVYEMWTMPPDDPRWDDIAEAQRQAERERFRFP